MNLLDKKIKAQLTEGFLAGLSGSAKFQAGDDKLTALFIVGFDAGADVANTAQELGLLDDQALIELRHGLDDLSARIDAEQPSDAALLEDLMGRAA